MVITMCRTRAQMIVYVPLPISHYPSYLSSAFLTPYLRIHPPLSPLPPTPSHCGHFIDTHCGRDRRRPPPRGPRQQAQPPCDRRRAWPRADSDGGEHAGGTDEGESLEYYYTYVVYELYIGGVARRRTWTLRYELLLRPAET